MTLFEKHKSLIRFVIVGCINTGVDFLGFTILHSVFGVEKLLCQSAGYSLGVINSYIMNKLWTFESKSSKLGTLNEIIRFVIINAISLGVSLFGLKLLTENYGLNTYLSKLIVTAAAQLVNFSGYKMWVFKKT